MGAKINPHLLGQAAPSPSVSKEGNVSTEIPVGFLLDVVYLADCADFK